MTTGAEDVGAFGRLLQRHRQAAGLSQEELAERAGLSRRGISDLERGVRRLPYPATVRRLAEALGLQQAEQAALLAADFGIITRRHWAEVYLQGLFLDGERKSIQPLSQRVSVPGWRGDTEQALQLFVNQSGWDEQAVLRTYRRVLAESLADPAGVIVIDDTGFPKKGRHSVGVARQYSGTLGKTDNCQIAVSLHYVARMGDYPLALRLFLPEPWTSQPQRMEAVHVPAVEQLPKSKGEIALGLLDLVRKDGLPHQAVVADAGYGVGVDFRHSLDLPFLQ